MKKKSAFIKIDETFLREFQIATFWNAKRLVLESHRFFHQRLYPTSTFLSITAIEEMGKYYLCRILAIRNKRNELTQKDISNLLKHPTKLRNSFMPPFPFEKERKLSPNISRFWELVADKKLMRLRNNCLYTDLVLKSGKILSPNYSSGEEDALYFLETAYEIIILQVQSSLKSLDCEIARYVNFDKETPIFAENLEQLRKKVESKQGQP